MPRQPFAAPPGLDWGDVDVGRTTIRAGRSRFRFDDEYLVEVAADGDDRDRDQPMEPEL